MITYELAKKLKDAGYPLELYPDTEDSIQQDKNINVFKKPLRSIVRIDYVYFYFPTLPELIEACGLEYKGTYFRWLKYEFIQWSAQARRHPPFIGDVRAKGKTPEEAVANLWLALQNNK